MEDTAYKGKTSETVAFLSKEEAVLEGDKRPQIICLWPISLRF